jgi:hypothetical protein
MTYKRAQGKSESVGFLGLCDEVAQVTKQTTAQASKSKNRRDFSNA